jgi:UDP-N-acetylmuramoyl-L-alanyl-D-glutamate--2,6-diaminopimelate ligase
MRLGELISGLAITASQVDPELEIRDIVYDSRQVRPGCLFTALRGHQQDGHRFLPDAISKGAAAVVGEDLQGIRDRVAAWVQVPDARRALAEMATRFFDFPFRDLNLIGITGTNGKTTTTYLLESILSAAGAEPGVIGTINYRFGGQIFPALNTTPESLDLMRLLRAMKDQGVTDVVMEVSSHALDQGRVAGCPFRVAVFTNLTRDHLDYHETMEKYFAAKSILFRDLGRVAPGRPATAVINLDDSRGPELMRLTAAEVLTYGLKKEAEVSAGDIRIGKDGLDCRLRTRQGEKDIRSTLIGEVNVYNILAATAAALALGLNLDTIARGIAALPAVPGRMQLVANQRGLTIVVDYSHKPEALRKALQVLNSFRSGRLITVFGCGGDRDRGKRPEMGRIAGEQSDGVVLTSDNPRSEDPLDIIREIENGITGTGLKKTTPEEFGRLSQKSFYTVEADRRKAIRLAIKTAQAGDIILIAGKGHEDYQIIKGRKLHFDDCREAALAVEEEK